MSYKDNIKLFALNSNKPLAEKIAKRMGLKLSTSSVVRFSDGEIQVNIDDSVRGKDVFLIQSTSAPVNDNLMELLIMIDAVRRASAASVNIVLPYYGYARQDRKTRAREPITAKLVADMIQAAGADRVLSLDLHAPQIQGFFDIPVDNLMGAPLLADYFLSNHLEEDAVVVSPDHGGVTRARKLAEFLGTSIAIVDKRRPKANVAEVMNIIGDVKGKRAILIDDMIDTGKSAVIGAKALLDAGAVSVKIAAVHPVFSDPCYSLIENGPFSEIIVTDSIPLDERFKKLKTVKVVSLANLLAECIERIDTDAPLSAVFAAYGLHSN